MLRGFTVRTGAAKKSTEGEGEHRRIVLENETAIFIWNQDLLVFSK